MADAEKQLKDQGISDIFVQDGEGKNPGENTSCSKTENGHDASENGTDSSCINQRNEAGQAGKTNGNSDTVSHETQRQADVFNGEIDLADPESVIKMLENVDLTEEDTEGLLQEAYNMNKKLKEMLRRQDMEASASSSNGTKSKSKTKSKQNSQKNGHDSSASSAQSSESGSRVGSSFGARKVLPPISGEKETSVYAIKLKRSTTNVPDTKGTFYEHAVPRSRSSKEPVRKDSQSPTRRKKANQGPRPEWNDRFNYT